MSTPASFLEDLVELIERERARSPQEASWELTKAYARLLIANGLARVGQAQRGQELVAAAEEVLAPLAKRERVPGAHSLQVHSYLLDVFRQRFADARAHRPLTTRLPPTVLELHDALDSVSRYKVDRFAELTHTVSPNGRIGTTDPIGSWIRRARGELANAKPSDADRLRELDVGLRAERIAAALQRTLAVDDQLAMLRAFAELPAAAALPMLASVVAWARDSTPQVQATACYVAVRYGYSELAMPLFGAVQRVLATAPATDEMTTVLSPLLRAKHWLHAVSDLTPALERLWAALPDDAASLPTLMLVAAGLTADRRDLRLGEVFDEQLEVSTAGRLPERLRQAKTLAAIATYVDPAGGRELLRRLAGRHWRTTTDSYGTNSHYCLSVLQLVETLVLAHVDLALANVNVLDPEQQAMLSSGFAL